MLARGASCWEGCDHSLGTGAVQLEHHSAASIPTSAACDAAEFCGAVEITSWVEDHTCKGIGPVCPSREAIQHRFLTGRIQFVDDAQLCGTTVVGSAKEIARRIPDQACGRRASIRRALEAVEHGISLRPRRWCPDDRGRGY